MIDLGIYLYGGYLMGFKKSVLFLSILGFFIFYILYFKVTTPFLYGEINKKQLLIRGVLLVLVMGLFTALINKISKKK